MAATDFLHTERPPHSRAGGRVLGNTSAGKKRAMFEAIPLTRPGKVAVPADRRICADTFPEELLRRDGPRAAADRRLQAATRALISPVRVVTSGAVHATSPDKR